MPLVRFEITKTSAFAYGYERVDGIAHYAVDPEHAANAGIVDLDLAERDDDGLVPFSGDLTFLRPADPAKANGGLLLNVPNRGGQTVGRLFCSAAAPPAPTAEIDPGDGFLFRHGWSVGIVGWQWDVPHPSVRYGLRPPVVRNDKLKPRGQMQLRIQPTRDRVCFNLTDQHVGAPGTHDPIPADPAFEASLWQRPSLFADPERIDPARWRFARDEGGRPVDDATHIWLDGGFKAGRIYDIVYTPVRCPVGGAGLLAFRDAALFARSHPASPVHGLARQVIGEGISQCGRFLRTLLQTGLVRGEDGAKAFDGLLVHIAGGRRGEFNQRYGQPSVQPTPSFGHLFPFACEPQTDARTGRTAGLHDRLGDAAPKIFYTDTSSEYWRGDASLAHTDVNTGADVELPANARRYLFASTQHGPGEAAYMQVNERGDAGANWHNQLDYVPVYRAALENLRAWIADGAEPPSSAYPRLSDGTAVTRETAMETLGRIPGMTVPIAERLNRLRLAELGPDADKGISGDLPAKLTGAPYPSVVSAVDGDGNELAGVRLPDLTAPAATHTGFNPRDPETGAEGQILEYVGSTWPLPRDAAARQAAGDPRPSLAERYADRDDYRAKVRKAAEALMAQGTLLAEDVEVCVDNAAARYDAALEHGA
ncbi:MAG: alpha/beta hydrolase domain-containing protein [Alphaproteobacteria bacterium]